MLPLENQIFILQIFLDLIIKFITVKINVMFKVKKHSKRALPDRNVLVQTPNNNQTPLPTIQDKPYRRPNSVRLNKKITSQQRIQPLQTASVELLSTEVINSQPKIFDRESICQEVRRISAMMFKDRMGLFGEFKQQMIKRVTEKSLVLVPSQSCQRKQWIQGLIEKQMARLQMIKETNSKYQRSCNRIQEMLTQRISNLSTMR